MEHSDKIDRRILRTKESITKSFLELFLEKEFEQITINEIAERANVNRGTIYLHYSDKYDLLDKCIKAHISHLTLFCMRRESIQVNKDIELKRVFDYFKDHFLFFFKMFSNQRVFIFRERLQNFISANLIDKIEQMETKPDIDKEINAQFMASAFIGIVEWWIRHEMPHSSEYMAIQVKKLFEKNEVYSIYH